MTNNANSKTTSKFAAVLAAKNNSGNRATENELPPSRTAMESKALKTLSSPQETQTAPRRVGRPNAKRSDPEFVQTTAYIRKETHRDVKIALLHESGDRDFSELIEELLVNWLKSSS